MSKESGQNDLQLNPRREAKHAERESKSRRKDQDERRREGAKLRGREVGRQRAARLERQRESEWAKRKETKRAAEDWNGERGEVRLQQQQQQLPRKRCVGSGDRNARAESHVPRDGSEGGRASSTSSGGGVGRRKRLRARPADIGNTSVDASGGGSSSKTKTETNGGISSISNVVSRRTTERGRRRKDDASETRMRRSGDQSAMSRGDGKVGRAPPAPARTKDAARSSSSPPSSRLRSHRRCEPHHQHSKSSATFLSSSTTATKQRTRSGMRRERARPSARDPARSSSSDFGSLSARSPLMLSTPAAPRRGFLGAPPGQHSFRRPNGSALFDRGGGKGLPMVGSPAAVRPQGTGTLASPAAAAAALGKGSGTLALVGGGGGSDSKRPAASSSSVVCGMGTLAVWSRATAL